ncbi:MAG: glycosyltransferase family 4 protein [Kiritimatiellaeota bacterium]|nr:glycosyltransferase family 4 protein [Kiritimatiellota bacterium]
MLRIIQLTPGTGNYYCGSCLRDNALARALLKRGHDVLMVPLYLPIVTDEPSASADVPIFLNGISVYLEQNLPFLRRMPEVLNRTLRAPGLLRLAARLAGLTTAKGLGQSAVSMLQGENGRQAGEMERLVEWLRTQPPPDVLCLSNSLLGGLTRRLKEQFRAPVVCTLQGEDSFLDSLPEPYRRQTWKLLAQRCAESDHFIAVSRYFGDAMRARLGLAAERVTVVPPGIAAAEFAPAAAAPAPPAIGYLARMHHAKGLGTLVEAFIQLKQGGRFPALRLRVAGAQTGTDERYVRLLQQKLAKHGALAQAEFLPNLDRRAKQEFLRSLTVFSVPATYGEAFGVYVLEAMASGVPVVQPRHGAFPELLEQTGGGILCEPGNPVALAAGLQELLLDPDRARRLGAAGCAVVRERYSVDAMARQVEEVLERVVQNARARAESPRPVTNDHPSPVALLGLRRASQ